MANACDNFAHQLKDAVDTADILGTPLSPNDMRKIVGQGGKPARKPMDYVNSFIINGMLSGLASTGYANWASLVMKMAHSYVDEIADSGIRKLRGKKDRYTIAEINAAYKAAVMQMPLMYKMGLQGLKKGYPLDIDVSLSQMAAGTGQTKKEVLDSLRKGLIEANVDRLVRQHGKTEIDARAAAEAAFKNERDVMEAVQGMFNEKYDYMQNVWLDVPKGLEFMRFINLPTQFTVAIDEAGKAFFRQYKANQILARQATEVAEKTGQPWSEVFNGYVEAMTKSKGGVAWKDMKSFDDREYLDHFRQTIEKLTGDASAYEKSKEYALREMFQSQLTGVVRASQDIVNKNSGWGARMLIPFMKTPWNIGKQAIAYTPAGWVIKKSPLGKARTRKTSTGGEVIDDRYLGAYHDFTEDEMLARAAVGTVMMGTLAAMTDSESITGAPRNAQEAQYMKDRGIPERSILIGDKWIPYGRIEPLATAFGLVADMKRALKEYDENPRDWETTDKALQAMATSLKQNIMQKTFFEQFTTLLAGATEVQGSAVESTISGIARPFVPTIVSQIARAVDDKERQAGQGGDPVSRIKERMMQRIPFVREMLPEEYGLFGPREAASPVETFLSMKFVDTKNLTPVQKLANDIGIEKIRPPSDFKQAGINSEQLSEYRRMSAVSAQRVLEDLMKMPSFVNADKRAQKIYAERAIERSRRMVNKQFLWKIQKQDPEIARRLNIMMQQKRGEL